LQKVIFGEEGYKEFDMLFLMPFRSYCMWVSGFIFNLLTLVKKEIEPLDDKKTKVVN
jgi:hypothetical protein